MQGTYFLSNPNSQSIFLDDGNFVINKIILNIFDRKYPNNFRNEEFLTKTYSSNDFLNNLFILYY
jgi:hypothetical protein